MIEALWAMTGAKQIMQAQAVNNHTSEHQHHWLFAPCVSFTRRRFTDRVRDPRQCGGGRSGTDFSGGTIENTGRDLDIAVNGKGFIAVRGTDGQEAYTRAGDLRLTPNRRADPPAAWRCCPIPGRSCCRPRPRFPSAGTVRYRCAAGLRAVRGHAADRIKLVNPATSTCRRARMACCARKAAPRPKATTRCRSPPATWSRATSNGRAVADPI